MYLLCTRCEFVAVYKFIVYDFFTEKVLFLSIFMNILFTISQIS